MVSVTLSQSPPVKGQPSTLTLPFFVSDEHKHPVAGITQADLLAFGDSNTPLTVLAVRNASELPLRLGLLIDTSGSQKDSSKYTEAMKERQDFLLDVLKGPDDRAFIMAFADSVKSSEFLTHDQIPQVRVDTQPGGGTALYDAVVFACNRIAKSDPDLPARRVLVLLTDGEDDASEATREIAIVAAQVAGVVIFSLDTSESQTSEKGAKAFKEFSSRTGGETIRLRGRGVKMGLAEVEDQIAGMYGVTFSVPSGHAGRHRKFELKPLPDKKLNIRAPQGYYATSE
jgi:Ca-activated chloride channel homolog